MRIVKIDNYDLANLERLHYKNSAFEALLKNIALSQLDDEIAFNKIFESYMQTFIDYQKEKDHFSDQFVNNNLQENDVFWEIDFERKELKIHTKND